MPPQLPLSAVPLLELLVEPVVELVVEPVEPVVAAPDPVDVEPVVEPSLPLEENLLVVDLLSRVVAARRRVVLLLVETLEALPSKALVVTLVLPLVEIPLVVISLVEMPPVEIPLVEIPLLQRAVQRVVTDPPTSMLRNPPTLTSPVLTSASELIPPSSKLQISKKYELTMREFPNGELPRTLH